MERGVSDPASRARRWPRAREAGSLTPCVSGRLFPQNAARIRVRIVATSVPRSVHRSRRPGRRLMSRRLVGRYARERWWFSGVHSNCSCG